jgi:4-hydroxy-tetrahydrodipicolinate synthase
MSERKHPATLILPALLLTLAGCAGMPHASKPPAPCPCAWGGIYPTVVTPFCCDGGVDIASLEQQLRHELGGGVHGLLVLGTIGEGQYTSPMERSQVISTAVRVACGAVPVVVGIHTGDVDEGRCQLLQAKQLGAAAVLVKYTDHPKASGAEVLGFIAALSEMHALPVFYYHYPSQTGLHLKPKDIAAILSLPGVVGIKESTLDLREVQAHIGLACEQGKVFLSGTALNLTQFMGLGGHGAMCPEAVLLPGPTVQAYSAFQAGKPDEARALQKELFTMAPLLRDRGGSAALTRAMLMTASDHKLPVPMGKDQPQARLKAALNCLGIPTSPVVKCPLPPLTRKDQERVAKTVKRLKAIDWCGVVLQVPPEPLHACHAEEEGGMLLKTGAFQLGPGVGKDLLRSQSDEQWGF